MRRFKPPQVVIFSFLAAILVGTAILSLPQSSATDTSIGVLDAFFTATSATCVTGLIVRDTGRDFSQFGQGVILFLIQIGGLGIMTLSTFFAILLGKKLTIQENLVIKSALDHHAVVGVKMLIIYILFVTFAIEAAGALLLYQRFGSFYYCIFHSVSAFCNAGFSLNSNSFSDFRGDFYINFVMIGLILLGGIGFIVLLDASKIARWFFRNVFLRKGLSPGALAFPRMSLQTKIVASVTLSLLCLGTLVFFFLEKENILRGMGFGEKILVSFFHSVTPRTAGFNTVSIKDLASPTMFFLIILMFIGASPGSTGGGIKTATLGVLIAGCIAMFKGKDHIHIFRKTLPRETFRKAFIIVSLAVAWIICFTMFLSFVEIKMEGMPNYLLRILFEVASAFGTVGLTAGITPVLTSLGKVFIIVTMFVGRVGPLTLALAVTAKEEVMFFKYPEEKIMVG